MPAGAPRPRACACGKLDAAGDVEDAAAGDEDADAGADGAVTAVGDGDAPPDVEADVETGGEDADEVGRTARSASAPVVVTTTPEESPWVSSAGSGTGVGEGVGLGAGAGVGGGVGVALAGAGVGGAGRGGAALVAGNAPVLRVECSQP